MGEIVHVNERAAELHGWVRLAVGPDDYSRMYSLFTEEGRPYPSADLPRPVPCARARPRGTRVGSCAGRTDRGRPCRDRPIRCATPVGNRWPRCWSTMRSSALAMPERLVCPCFAGGATCATQPGVHLVQVTDDTGAQPSQLGGGLLQVGHHDRRQARGHRGAYPRLGILQGKAAAGGFVEDARGCAGTGLDTACSVRSRPTPRGRRSGRAGRRLPGGGSRCRARTRWRSHVAGRVRRGYRAARSRQASSGGRYRASRG